MPYKVLKTTNPWEIILKETDTNQELSLMDRYSVKCHVCHYPLKSKVDSFCHKGLENHVSKISYITGHYYETDFDGNPNNWYGKLLKDISERPFRFSHELFVEVLKHRILNSDLDLHSLSFATMVPTSNQQMENLFEEISRLLNIKWIRCNDIFIKKEPVIHYSDRAEFVKNKYILKETADEIFFNFKHHKNILIFDDIFNQGFTLGHIINLLKTTPHDTFYLVTIARTLPKVFQKSFSFP